MVERVEKFYSHGSVVTEDVRCDRNSKENRNSKVSFCNMRILLIHRKLSRKTRKGLVNTHLRSTLSYGVESWNKSTTIRRKLEAMEMWLWRRMLRIPWTARRTNEEVLGMVGERRGLMGVVRRRQLKFFGHVMRREGLENLMLTGAVEGRR